MTTTRRTVLAAAFAPLLLPLRKLLARESAELARRPGPWDCRCVTGEEYARELRKLGEETMRAAKAMTPAMPYFLVSVVRHPPGLWVGDEYPNFGKIVGARMHLLKGETVFRTVDQFDHFEITGRA